jgi:HEPN domain-containing protein
MGVLKSPEEWLRQADYDMDTAQYMFEGERYVYAVFMCHLSIEKALKGLYESKLHDIPPKTHSLVGLLDRVNTRPPDDVARIILRLNDMNVTTRYPDELAGFQKLYTSAITTEILHAGREPLEWIKTQF